MQRRKYYIHADDEKERLRIADIEASHFAVCLLMPEDKVKAIFLICDDRLQDVIKRMAKIFLVDEWLMTLRLRDLDLIDYGMGIGHSTEKEQGK